MTEVHADQEIEAALLALATSEQDGSGWSEIETLLRNLRTKVKARHATGRPGRFPLALASLGRSIPRLKAEVRQLRPKVHKSVKARDDFRSVAAALALAEEIVDMLAAMDSAATAKREAFLAKILDGITVTAAEDLPKCTVSADEIEQRLTKYLDTHPFDAKRSAEWDEYWLPYRAELDAGE